MASFKTLKSTNITGDKVTATTFTASEYKNLPKATTKAAGIVKLDGQTIVENQDGSISVKFPSTGSNADMTEHMSDANIHVSNEDRANLNTMNQHLSRKELHFQAGEKEALNEKIEQILEELDKCTNSGNDNSSIDNMEIVKHVENTGIHFDSEKQKKSVIDFSKNSYVTSKQDVAGKIMVTDENKSIVPSNVDARVLNYISNMTKPLEVLLQAYSEIGHTHEDLIPDLSWHYDDLDIHFKDGEKERIIDSVNKTEQDVTYMRENFDLNNIFNRKISARFIRYTMFVSEGEGELNWVNIGIFIDGENVAPLIPASQVSTEMAFTDQEILKLLDGNTTDVIHHRVCSCNSEHYTVIDLGSERDDISHIRIHNGVSEDKLMYEMRVEVSNDADEWTVLFDTEVQGTYTEDKYGKIHILNYEAYTDFLTCKTVV